MTEKEFVHYEHKGADYILENPNTDLDFIEMLGDCLDEKEIVNRLNELYEENDVLKQSNNEAIELILDGVVEMHDGKRDYAETIFNKAIKLLKGDIE